MYISLDIETTGLSYERDDVIEIGAAKFDENKIIDTFKTFIKIDYPLPPLITHITGITDNDLKDAPALQKIYPSLLDFIEDLPVVGHNIDFDLDFLKEKGIEIKNPRYDTLKLSTILMPGLPSHSLEIITGILQIEHKEKHRALDDAIATSELFNKLTEKISNIDKETLSKMKSAVKRSDWQLKNVFISAEPKTDKEKQPVNINDFENKVQLEFNKKNVLSFYEEDGPLSKTEKDYEMRMPQITMSDKITDAFEGEYNLLCEAGTGTGKTIAYLVPSVFRARDKDKKVVISTHTKHLQDQLQKKDVPVLKKAINQYLNNKPEENPFESAVLKGRKNYLSQKRFEQFMEKSHFQDHEVTLIIKVLLWLPLTKTGDMEELTLQGKEKFSWKDICCDAVKCPHTDNEYLKKCYLAKAREKAQKADIIITNHALLVSDTVTPSPVLPEYEYLVVDEAHHLEAETTKALTLNITSDLLNHPLNILKELLKKTSLLDNHRDEIESLKSKTDVFFGILGMFYEKNIEYANSINNLTIREHMKNSLEWNKLISSAENIHLKGKRLIKNINESLDEAEENLKIKTELETLDEYLNAISFVVLERSVIDVGPYVTWIYKKWDESLGIMSAPLKIGSHLSGTLFGDKKSITLTSATLTTNNTFDYLRKQLSLGESFNEIRLPSHFSYPDQVELVIHRNIAAPNSAGFFEQMSDIILESALENMGRMLVLFTSKRTIEATYLKLMPVLKEKDITILAQNVSGSRNKILELFKQDPEHSIIFGTNSFWEGIDIKGASLNCVIIQKLPFDPPDDPVHSARSKLHDDPFFDYQIPRAILRFKQGFGRLIRSSSDTGKVIILDSRIVTKTYGDIFINSLPEGIKIQTEA
jgi:predicted DnaQ family exonuclease/DinG family helicase